jgi:outer membrane protein assembly factor BamA
MHPFALLAAAFLLTLGSGPAAAQTVPDEEEKQSTVAKAKKFVQDKGLLDLFNGESDGFYPRIGGMTTGSGLALGGGYRQHIAGDSLFVDVSGALSTKIYRAADARVRWPMAFEDRLELWTIFRYRNYTQEDYFGMGGGTPRSDRTSYAIDSTDISARALFKVRPWLHVGSDIGRFSPGIGPGTDDMLPVTQERFTDLTAPGLAAQPAFLYGTLFVESDYRDIPGDPTRGGFVRAKYGLWNDRDLGLYDFGRFDAEAAHFFPTSPNQVVALHSGIAYVNNKPGARVPFYFLPYIGGSDTIRSFEEFRFRDENIFYMNAEYRVNLFKFLQVAPFVDAGKSTPNWNEIDFTHLKTAYGVGFRVRAMKRTFLRFDVATGGEGPQFFTKFGKSF